MFLIDSHCHLDLLNYKNIHKNIDDVLEKANNKSVKFILTIATSLSNCKNIIKQTINYKNIACTCGIHPLNTEKYNYEALLELSSHSKVIALGESGLDYKNNENHENLKYQKKLFRDHIRTGIILKKPVIIHNREASTDIIKILFEEKIEKCGAVLHCFTEDYSIARKFLDMGLYISFSGIMTFNNVEKIINSIRFIPLNRLLIETDSPYLTPVPYRKKENQPAFVKIIAEQIAKIKKIDLEYLAEITTKNFCDIFKVKLNIKN